MCGPAAEQPRFAQGSQEVVRRALTCICQALQALLPVRITSTAAPYMCRLRVDPPDADGLLSEEKQRVAAGLVSSAASAQDSLMQLSSFLSFESEGAGRSAGRWRSQSRVALSHAAWFL